MDEKRTKKEQKESGWIIYTVSATKDQGAQGVGVFDDSGRLVVAHVLPFAGGSESIGESMAAKHRNAIGCICLIEGPQEHLESGDLEGACLLPIEGLDECYRLNSDMTIRNLVRMVAAGVLIVAPEHKDLLADIMNRIRKVDDEYRIDGKWLTASHRALLLCVTASMIGSSTGEYFEQFLMAVAKNFKEGQPAAQSPDLANQGQ